MEEIVELLEELLGGQDRVEIASDDPKIVPHKVTLAKAKVRSGLPQKGFMVDPPRKDRDSFTITRVNKKGSAKVSESKEEKPSKVEIDRSQHTYVAPKIAKEIMSVMLDDASHIILFKGGTGTGKTVCAHYLTEELDMELFQINCHGEIPSEEFFGEKSIEIDEATGQNHIVWKSGIVEKAMRAGLDENGEELPDGKPGLLFIDEAGAMPPHVAIGLNRVFESDDPRRTFVVNADGGRVVRSHSKFRIILSANTALRGATSMAESLYTAQTQAQDISLINRTTVCFKFGYNKTVEKRILQEKIGDDAVVNNVLKFRDGIRDALRNGRLNTPFSTRHIVNIADAYRVFGDISKAIYYTTVEFLLPQEIPVYGEVANMAMGIDILKEVDAGEDDMDFM